MGKVGESCSWSSTQIITILSSKLTSTLPNTHNSSHRSSTTAAAQKTEAEQLRRPGSPWLTVSPSLTKRTGMYRKERKRTSCALILTKIWLDAVPDAAVELVGCSTGASALTLRRLKNGSYLRAVNHLHQKCVELYGIASSLPSLCLVLVRLLNAVLVLRCCSDCP